MAGVSIESQCDELAGRLVVEIDPACREAAREA